MTEPAEQKYDAVDVKDDLGVHDEHHDDDHFGVPDQFLCPITHDIMLEPVILLGDGQTYEKHAIEEWLSSNDLAPNTGEELKSKEFAPNWALRRIVQEWRKDKAGAELRAEQKQRLETYLQPNGPYVALFDIELYIGEDEVLFRAVRAMLSSLSTHLKTILGDKEQNSFIIRNLTPASFTQILRLAYNLDPQIDADNVLTLLQAAHLLHLDMLKDECLTYMADNIAIPKVAKIMMLALEPNSDYGIDDKLRDQFIQMLIGRDLDASSAMTVFNSAWALGVLTAELEAKICKIMTNQAEEVLVAPSFLFTRLEMMKELLECDIFFVQEEELWKRVCDWAKKQYELEMSDTGRPIQAEDAKKKKDTDDFGGKLGMDLLSDAQQEKLASSASQFPDGALKYLRQMIPSFRFPVMDPEFFAKEVAHLLTRQEALNVLTYLVNPSTESVFSAKKRADVSGSGGGAPFNVVSAHPEFEKAQSLGNVEIDSQWSRVSMTDAGGKQWFVTDCMSEIRLNKFDWKNFYDDDDTIHNIKLFMLPPDDGDIEFSDALAAGDEKWELVQDIEIAKSTDWQTHQVELEEGKAARYWKWLVVDVYGSETRYTCLNHIKLHYAFSWKTNFANKADK